MRNYPYLGQHKDNENVVVFFVEPDYGVVVLSNVTDNPNLAFGKLGDFDESYFNFLSPEQQISIHN